MKLDLSKKLLTATFFMAAVIAGGASVSAAETTNWRYFGVVPAANKFGAEVENMFKRIADRTDGNFNIEYVYFGETPYKSADALDLMTQELVEAVEFLPGYYTSTYPILAAPELPYLSSTKPSPAQAQEIGDKAWNSELMKAEIKNVEDSNNSVEVLSFYYPPMNYWFKPQVVKLEDIKGLRIRDFAKESMVVWEKLGATPVSMDGAEIYTALQRGVLGGVVTGSTSMMGQKWGEVLKSGFITNFKVARSTMVINKSAYAMLSDEYREILTEESERTAKDIRIMMEQNESKELESIKDNLGFTITEVSDSEYQKLHEIAQTDAWPGWVERVGGNAQQVLDSILAAVGK